MVIIHVTAHYIEKLGEGYQVYQLVKEQVLLGHDVHIVTCSQGIEMKNYKENAMKLGQDQHFPTGISQSELGATIHRLKKVFRFVNRTWWSGFKQKLKDIKPDLIIVHSILEFQSIRLLFYHKEFNCNIIYDDHTTINVVRKDIVGKLAYFLFRIFFARRLCKVANKIIGISDSCVEVLNKFFGINSEKVEMIPLGTDTSLFYPDKNKRDSYRNSLSIEDDETLVVYTGKIYQEKKVHLIIDALNDKDFQNEKKIIILIIGTVYNAYKEELQDSIDRSINRVIVLSHIAHDLLPEVYNAADICVWPAHTTTSTLDASACACPIICSDYKKERYKNDNGIGIKDGNIADLKRALFLLAFDENLRRKMGNNGVDLIKKEHSWTAINQQFIE